MLGTVHGICPGLTVATKHTCFGSKMPCRKGWGVTRVSPIPPWVPLTLLVLPRSRTKHTRAAASTPDPATAAKPAEQHQHQPQ